MSVLEEPAADAGADSADVLLLVASLLPTSDRLRAREVCPRWLSVLRAPAAWTVADLSYEPRPSDALLRAAAAAACGGLTKLVLRDVGDRVSVAAVCAVASAQPGLTVLVALCAEAKDEVYVRPGGALGVHGLCAADVAALRSAAPAGAAVTLDAEVGDHRAAQLLRGEPPFGAVSVRRLCISVFDPGARAPPRPWLADAAAHPALRELRVPLPADVAGMEALVGAASRLRLTTLLLEPGAYCGPPVAAHLQRLLALGSLEELRVMPVHQPLFYADDDGGAESRLGAAVASSPRLVRLVVDNCTSLGRGDGAALLLGAAAAHGTLRALAVRNLRLDGPDDSAAFGAAAGRPGGRRHAGAAGRHRLLRGRRPGRGRAPPPRPALRRPAGRRAPRHPALRRERVPAGFRPGGGAAGGGGQRVAFPPLGAELGRRRPRPLAGLPRASRDDLLLLRCGVRRGRRRGRLRRRQQRRRQRRRRRRRRRWRCGARGGGG